MKANLCTLVATVCILAAVQLHAQNRVYKDVPLTNGHQTDIGLGYSRIGLSALNNALGGAGFGSVRDPLSATLTATYVWNGFLIQGNLSGLSSGASEGANDLKTSFYGYQLGIGVGYNVFQKHGFRVSPYVSLNTYRDILTISDERRVTGLNDLASGNSSNARLHFRGGTLDAGVQLDKLFLLKNTDEDCPNRAAFLDVGFRVGYSFGNAQRVFYNNATELNNPPLVNHDGWFAKFFIGMAVFRK